MLCKATVIVVCALSGPVLADDMVFPKRLPPKTAAPQRGGCEWAGPGFGKLEGSDTCVKLGGSVRAQFSTSGSGGSGTWK